MSKSDPVSPDNWEGVDRRADAFHRHGTRTYGSKVQSDGPKTGTPSSGFKPKGARPDGDPRGDIKR